MQYKNVTHKKRWERQGLEGDEDGIGGRDWTLNNCRRSMPADMYAKEQG